MASSAGYMVGRRAELSQLAAALDALAEGRAGCLAVEGEAGIGKTRLLGELRRSAEERGHLVLAGSAAEFERDLPFGVWADALEAYVESQELGGHDDDAWLSDLGEVLPVLRRGDAPVARGDTRHRAHRAMRKLMPWLAESRGLVLVLDDLHWCDPASAELLVTMLRRGLVPHVLLALGYRSGAAPPKLSAALATPEAAVIELGPLSEEECALLAGEAVDTAEQAAIFVESGGNPFYALQLARSGAPPSHSASGDRMAASTGVPRMVAAALVEELEALSSEARLLLDAAAVAGDPFALDLALSIGELTPERGLQALDELLETRLVHATDVPRRFAFRHPLVRRAVYESVKGGWRLAAHTRAAAALAATGAAPSAQAHHVEQSAAEGDPVAVALLIEAGDSSAARAPAGAARWYAAALRLMPHADVAARLTTLSKLAQALRSTGDLESCSERLLEAIELVPAEAAALRVTLVSAYTASQHFLGHHDGADRRLAAAFDSLSDKSSPEAVAALLALAAGAFFTLDVEGGQNLGRRALDAACDLGDPALIGAAAAAHAHACANGGDIAGAQSSIDEAAARLDELPDDEIARRLEAVNRLAWSEFMVERYDDSIRHAQRGIAVARATGQDQFIPMTAGAQALSMTAKGDMAGAAALQAEALETAQVTANDYVTCWVLSNTAHVLTAAGDLDGARRVAEQATGLVEHRTGRIAAMARLRLATTLRQLGESAEQTEALLADVGGWSLEPFPPSWRVLYLAPLAQAELERGTAAAAEVCAAATERAAGELALPLATALAQRARGALCLAGDDAAGALDLALASFTAADRAGAPIEAAKSRLLAGRALVALGERPRAVSLLREAEATFDAAGVLRGRGEARRELRRLGARAEPRGPATGADGGLPSLSPREREIADLITARMTNREIAQELFLSEKTIESHLRNIFVKLGASSRVDVARAVDRDVAS